MSKHIAFLSIAAAVVGASVLPAAAADFYDGGDRPLAFHSRDDVYIDGGRARVEHSQDLRPADRYRRAPGPVAFDERGYDRPAYGYGEPSYRRPAAVERYGYDRPAAFDPGPDRPYRGEAGDRYGDGYRPVPLYRPAAGPVGPGYGGVAYGGAALGGRYGDGYGGPDVGCTIEQAQSTTPLGWRKVVTHRTCYRR